LQKISTSKASSFLFAEQFLELNSTYWCIKNKTLLFDAVDEADTGLDVGRLSQAFSAGFGLEDGS